MLLNRTKTLRRALVGLAAGTALLGSGLAQAVTVQETGSSLVYPLFNLWIPAYTKDHSEVQISSGSTGSGTGIAEATKGLVQIGASDAYLSGALRMQHKDLMNIPLAISSQMVNYNVPGLNGDHLKLSGAVLADIYAGKVRYWDAKAIEKINPGVKLPHKQIIPVHRTDGSGDTFIFTQYLSKSTPWWNKKFGFGTTVSWAAVPGELGMVGNPGMVDAVKNNPYSIAYIGISYKDQIDGAGLGEARLGNRAGHFVLPEVKTIKAAAAAMVPKTPHNQAISLIYAPGAESYPIINYEYAIVHGHQPDADTAKAVKNLLSWAVSPNGGNAGTFMEKVHFVPLPDSARKMSLAQINKVHG